MNPLIEKIKKARERKITVEGLTLIISRPTHMQVMDISSDKEGMKQSEILRRFVVGWQGVTELDLFPGGTGVPVDFDTELFIEWVQDKPALWATVTDQVIDLYHCYIKSQDEIEKKPEAG